MNINGPKESIRVNNRVKINKMTLRIHKIEYSKGYLSTTPCVEHILFFSNIVNNWILKNFGQRVVFMLFWNWLTIQEPTDTAVSSKQSRSKAIHICLMDTAWCHTTWSSNYNLLHASCRKVAREERGREREEIVV